MDMRWCLIDTQQISGYKTCVSFHKVAGCFSVVSGYLLLTFLPVFLLGGLAFLCQFVSLLCSTVAGTPRSPRGSSTKPDSWLSGPSCCVVTAVEMSSGTVFHWLYSSLFDFLFWADHTEPDHSQCGGLRKWGSSAPCCLPPVKASDSKRLPRQRMSLCYPQRDSTVLVNIYGAVHAWLRWVFLPSPKSKTKNRCFHSVPTLTHIMGGVHLGSTPLGIREF